jgi:DNA-binding response OmpR family regulator
MRVVLVSDEPPTARMFAEGLRQQPHAVDVAHDGVAADTRPADVDHDITVLLNAAGRSTVHLCRHADAAETQRRGRTPAVHECPMNLVTDRK